jgi:hypothetical protein
LQASSVSNYFNVDFFLGLAPALEMLAVGYVLVVL